MATGLDFAIAVGRLLRLLNQLESPTSYTAEVSHSTTVAFKATSDERMKVPWGQSLKGFSTPDPARMLMGAKPKDQTRRLQEEVSILWKRQEELIQSLVNQLDIDKRTNK